MAGRSAKEILNEFYEKEYHYLSPDGGDFSIMADLIHPDCIMHQADSLPFGGEWKGVDGLKAWLEAFDRTFSSVQLLETEQFDCGLVVITKIKMVAVSRNSGKSFPLDCFQYVRAEDDRLIEFRPFYWDTAQILEACAQQ
ncbi:MULTISPECIES: nuclear transport factor 2 family protein [Sphingobium]|uniref:nuclear transport factor 2 family protein n=1 Tax=Sphingobium TaxID=165695 RepID=UPI00159C9081|nr:nuclear transport factor 2 family protein [Sphingobium sp. 15-1]